MPVVVVGSFGRKLLAGFGDMVELEAGSVRRCGPTGGRAQRVQRPVRHQAGDEEGCPGTATHAPHDSVLMV